MPMSKLQRTSLFIVAVLVTIGVAYVLGVGAAGIVQKYRMKSYRAEKTQEILKQMGSGLAIGVAMPDADLEDLAGNPVKLSEAVGARSLVMFISPDCEACKIALQRISEIDDGRDNNDFVLIANAGPTEMVQLRDSLNLHCRFLYDNQAEFGLKLGVFTFPFGVVVNQSMVIEDIVAGAPEEDQLTEIVRLNRQ